jgi:hypothetical protein
MPGMDPTETPAGLQLRGSSQESSSEAEDCRWILAGIRDGASPKL